MSEMEVWNGRSDRCGPDGMFADRLRAFVEQRKLLFRGERWRYVIEKEFVVWSVAKRSPWHYRTQAQAQQAAIDFMEEWCSSDERRTYVED